MREIKLHHINKEEPETGIRIHAQGDVEGSDVHFYALTGFEFKFNNETVREVPIVFQQGDPAKGWNGLTIESLLAVAGDRLEHLQQGQWACTENEVALMNIHKAIQQLHNRHKRLLNNEADLRVLRAEDGGEEAKQIAEAIAAGGGDWEKKEAQAEQDAVDAIQDTIGVEVGGTDALPRLVPSWSESQKNHFLSMEQVMPVDFTMDDQGTKVITMPLKVDMNHDLITLSYHQDLLDAGLIKPADGVAVDGNRIEGVYIEFKYGDKTEVLPFSMDNEYGPAKIEPFGGQAMTLALSFEGKFVLAQHSLLAVVDPNNTVNWATSSIMRELIDEDFEVEFHIGLSGVMKLPFAHINVTASGLTLTRICKPGQPDVDADISEEKKAKIVNLLNDASVIGYDIIAYRQHADGLEPAA